MRIHHRLLALTSAGLLTKEDVRIVPHRRTGKPLYEWEPGVPAPNADELADRIRQARADSTAGGSLPTPPTVVYRITDRGAAVMGAFRGERNAAELRRHGLRLVKLACRRHGLDATGASDARAHQNVSELFFTAHTTSTDLVRGWRLLHRTPAEFVAPDVLVYGAADNLPHAVVFATHWCGCVARRFHNLCSNRRMPYSVYGG